MQRGLGRGTQLGYRAYVHSDDLVVKFVDELRPMTSTCSDGEASFACPPIRHDLFAVPLPWSAVIEERANILGSSRAIARP